jgi:hypothetical protein
LEEDGIGVTLIKIMDLQAVGLGSMDWMDLTQDTNGWQGVVNVAMNLLIPNFVTS